MKKLILFGIVFLFLVSFVYAPTGTITTFTNGLDIENLTTNQNITRFINFPIYTFVDVFTLNLRDIDLDYVEDNSTLNWTFSGNWGCDMDANHQEEKFFDNDTSTYTGHSSGTCGAAFLYWNTTTPSYAENDSILVVIASTGEEKNGTIYGDCLKSEVHFRMDGSDKSVTCHNGSDWRGIMGGGFTYVADKYILWKNNTNKNLNIYIGDNPFDTYNINDTETTISLNQTKMNEVMKNNCSCTNCTTPEDNCSMPFTFYSDTINILEKGSMEANYTFDLDNCTTYGNRTLNITFYDSNGDYYHTKFETAFDFDYDTTPQYNFSFEGTQTNFSMCIHPSWAYFYADAVIEYNNQTYNTYQLYLTNATQNIDLYIQDSTETTQVTFTVQDYETDPIEDAYIHILQWDTGTNSYRTTEILRTDSQGQAVGNIILVTQYYRFIIQYEGETKLIDPETKGVKIYTTTRTFTIPIEEVQYFDDKAEFNDISTSLTFNETGTDSFVFEWTNPSGSSVTGCMEVIERNQSGSYNLFTSCVSSASTSIVYAVTVNDCSNYIGTAYFDYSGYIFLVEDSPIEFGDECEYSFKDVKPGSKDPVFFSWFIIFGLAFIGIALPEFSFILICVGLVGMVILGLWDLAWRWIVGFIVIGGMLVWKFSRK